VNVYYKILRRMEHEQRIRLNGALPKIGIRPTIDGREKRRQGSFGGPDHGYVEKAAKLIEDNLRHASGEKVECVIADSTSAAWRKRQDMRRKIPCGNGVGVS
jgi:L-fucose isomerase